MAKLRKTGTEKLVEVGARRLLWGRESNGREGQGEVRLHGRPRVRSGGRDATPFPGFPFSGRARDPDRLGGRQRASFRPQS